MNQIFKNLHDGHALLLVHIGILALSFFSGTTEVHAYMDSVVNVAGNMLKTESGIIIALLISTAIFYTSNGLVMLGRACKLITIWFALLFAYFHLVGVNAVICLLVLGVCLEQTKKSQGHSEHYSHDDLSGRT